MGFFGLPGFSCFLARRAAARKLAKTKKTKKSKEKQRKTKKSEEKQKTQTTPAILKSSGKIQKFQEK